MFGPVSGVVFVGVVGVNRGRVRVVGGGADIEDKWVSGYGAVGWVADPERIVTSGVIAFDVRGCWCGGLGRVEGVGVGDFGMAVRVRSDEGWSAVGVVDVILVFRVAVRDERRWVVGVEVVGNYEVVFCDGA